MNIKLIVENEKDQNIDYDDEFELLVIEEIDYYYKLND